MFENVGPPLSTHTFDWPQFWFMRYLFSSGLLCLESMQRLRSIAFPVLASTSGRNRVTLGAHLPNPLPQIQLCSIKSLCKSSLSSGKWQDWSKFGDVPFFCPKSAKWCLNGQWHARRPPISHFFTQPDCLPHMYMLVLEMGQARVPGQNC